MNLDNALGRVRVVLSRTSHPGNIGAAARAMKTMGIHDLVLVDPDKPWVISSTRMAASAGNTPFDGQPVQGALQVHKLLCKLAVIHAIHSKSLTLLAL